LEDKKNKKNKKNGNGKRRGNTNGTTAGRDGEGTATSHDAGDGDGDGDGKRRRQAGDEGRDGATAGRRTRQRRAVSEAARDEEWVRWIARFRFVTAETLGDRFGVQARMANKRIAWLLAEDWVVRVPRPSPATPSAVVLSRRGATRLGLPRRKPPKRMPVEALEHELAIIRWVNGLEQAAAQRGDGARVLTERECRQAEAAGDGRYSVSVTGVRGTVENAGPTWCSSSPTARRARSRSSSP
jgi:hypothetical protein